MPAPLRAPLILAILLVATFTQPGRSASAGSADCEPSSASEMIAIATTYLEALNDETGLKALTAPFAPDIRRVEFPVPLIGMNQPGAVSATNEADLRAFFQYHLAIRLIERYGNVRWVADVPSCQVVAFWLLNFTFFPAGRGQVEDPRPEDSVDVSTHLAERFKVSGGLIREIEAIHWHSDSFESGSGLVNDGSCWPGDRTGTTGTCTLDWNTPAYETPAGCQPPTSPGDELADRRALMRVGGDYLGALVTGEIKNVKLAMNARRTDFPFGATMFEDPTVRPGPVVEGAADVAERVGKEAPNRTGIRDVRWFIDTATCQAVAYYLIDYAIDEIRTVDPRECVAKPGSNMSVVRDVTSSALPPQRCTSHVASRFLVLNNRIHEIESIEYTRENNPDPEGSCWPRDPNPVLDETFRVLPCPYLP